MGLAIAYFEGMLTKSNFSFEYSWEEWRHRMRSGSHTRTLGSRVRVPITLAEFPT